MKGTFKMTIRKKYFCTTLLIALVLFFLSGVVMATEKNNTNPSLTISQYQAFLAKESPKDLTQFNKLSQSDKETFLQLLSNPDTYLNPPSQNPDIVVSDYSEAVSSAPSLLKKSKASTIVRRTSATHSMKIKGITTLQYRLETGYRVKNNRIRSVVYTNAYVVKNLNPFVQTNPTSKSSYISGNKVYSRASYFYKIGPIKGLSVQVGTMYGRMTSYPNGKSTSHFWRAK
jgi:hypothetical protein